MTVQSLTISIGTNLIGIKAQNVRSCEKLDDNSGGSKTKPKQSSGHRLESAPGLLSLALLLLTPGSIGRPPGQVEVAVRDPFAVVFQSLTFQHSCPGQTSQPHCALNCLVAFAVIKEKTTGS